MDKPAIVSIEDASGEVVYLRFIDAARIPEYTEALDKMMGDYVEILDRETGQTFYTLPDYVKNLIGENVD
jgi:hypothetical protein